jgi:hypothetical protein
VASSHAQARRTPSSSPRPKRSNEVFEDRFEAREIAETLDFIEWRMEIQALRLLEEQYETLNEARLD